MRASPIGARYEPGRLFGIALMLVEDRQILGLDVAEMPVHHWKMHAWLEPSKHPCVALSNRPTATMSRMRLLLALLILAAPCAAAETPLILASDAHWTGDALPEQGWLALCEDGQGTELLPARITTVTAGEGVDIVQTGCAPSHTTVLFHSTPGLAAGPVTPARPSAKDLYERGTPVPLELAGRSYTLVLEASDEQLADARIVLHDGIRLQVLFEMNGTGDEPHFTVVWAGDLDRDGLLDLVMTMSGKYSYHPRALFLSSRAVDGEIVHEVAQTDDFSC